MNKKIRYKRAPKDIEDAITNGEDVTEWFNARYPLPAPDQLVVKEDTVKVTLVLEKKSLAFFKAHAKKQKVSYQRMIRNLVDHYVKAAQA